MTRRTPPCVRIFARGASSGSGQGVLRFTRRFIEVRPDQLNIPEAGGTPALYTEIVISENVAKKADVGKIKVNETKWSKPLMAAGWTAMPSVIIERQEALGLDALDMNIVLHMSHYWWTPDNLPHPSVERIAKAVGVKPRTVQKRIKTLHELGIIEREIAEKQKAKAERLARKKPKLTVVAGGAS